MVYSEEVLGDIRERNDIVEFINNYTQLKSKGNSYFGLCPFHKESTPSFSVNPIKQLFHCFGCGAGGNIYHFVMQMENYNFIEAVKYLAERINYDLPELDHSTSDLVNNNKRKMIYDIHKIVARFYHDNLKSDGAKKAIQYLHNRNILPNTQRKFGLGYSSYSKNQIYLFLKQQGYSDDIIFETGLVLKDKAGNPYDRFSSRIMFPIIDIQGRVIAFGGRIINESKTSPKYLNSPETLIFNKSQNLYGINFSRFSKNKEYIIVEGYMDVIAMHQAGFNNSVAVLGTAFNKNSANIIKKNTKSVTLIFDSDEAGTNATNRAIPILKEADLDIKVLQLKNAKDPDEYIQKFGKNMLENEIKNAKTYISFQIEQKIKDFNIEYPFEKIQFIKEVAKIISSLNQTIEREVFINEAASITGVSFETIFEEVEKNVKNFNINHTSKKYYNSKLNSPKNIDNKLEEAQNSILNIFINNLDIFNKVKDFLRPDEFLNEPYPQLAKTIYTLNEQKKHIVEADLISQIDDPLQQQKMAKIFMLQPNYSDINILEKAINDQIKIIKEAHINKNIDNIDNIDNINLLIQEKKNIQKLYINL